MKNQKKQIVEEELRKYLAGEQGASDTAETIEGIGGVLELEVIYECARDDYRDAITDVAELCCIV